MSDENTATPDGDTGDSDPQIELDNLKVEYEKLKKSAARESSGRDKKIAELTEMVEELQSNAEQERRRNATPKEIERLEAEDRAKEQAELMQRLAKAESEAQELRAANEFSKKVASMDIPPIFKLLMTDSRPSDVDAQEEWLEEREEAIKVYLYKENNQRRVGTMPQSGNGDRGVGLVSDKEYNSMSPEERTRYARSLTREQREELIKRDLAK